tara:strand:+ start:504 stop:1316 length:813 start_codon:yes stop_codon:yes gene_type:complete
MTSNKNLNTIAENYNTDKFDHGYTKIYEKYFENLRDQKLKILEIGIADGKSLLMWSDYFKNSLVIGIDIHQINIEEKKLNRANINVHQGSQSDKKFIEEIIKEYKQFDIIIDDGSHLAKDVKKSFELLFPALKDDGLYVIEDVQTSYNHFFGGNPFDLKYSNSHMNFFKQLTDSLNYQEIANPFYIEKKYDGKITNISFYHNMIFVRKGNNDAQSREVIKHSYEDMKFMEKSKRTGKKIQYFIKYKIFYKAYTLLLFVFNTIKKLLLFRI